jgi:cystatin-related protein
MARPPKKKPDPPRLPGQKFAIISIDQIFDVEFAIKYGTSARVPFQQNPDSHDRLIKGAILALRDYNKQNLTNYQFVNIEMATWQSAGGTLYYITFAAKNAENENQNEFTSFQAIVSYQRDKRQVQHIRIKGSSTWFTGSFSEPPL